MSQMVERVARAIERAGWKYARQQAVGNIPEMCEEMARAAIEAMMEPTDAMIDEGESHLIGTDADRFISVAIFRDMIQAALKENA